MHEVLPFASPTFVAGFSTPTIHTTAPLLNGENEETGRLLLSMMMMMMMIMMKVVIVMMLVTMFKNAKFAVSELINYDDEVDALVEFTCSVGSMSFYT